MSHTTDLLWGLNADVLSTLARKLKIRTITRKPELIDALDQLIQQNVGRILELLSDTERKLVAEAAFNGGRIDTARFEAKYGVACSISRHVTAHTASALHLLIGGS